MNQAPKVLPLKRRAFDQWKVASPWLRLGAAFTDQALIGFLTGSLLSFLFPQRAWTYNWFLTWLLLWPFVALSSQCVLLWLLKTTPGKKAFGIQLVSARPGKDLTQWQILQRATAWWMGVFTLGASWSTVLSRSDRRTWHDIFAETVVVHDGDEPHLATVLEKKIGQGWAVGVSLLLICILSTALLFQIKRLTNTGAQFTSLSPDKKTIEDYSWFLLLGELPKTKTLDFGLKEEKFVSTLQHFSKAKQLPLNERFSYYKANLQESEDWLCRPGQAGSEECQSVQLMAALLSHSPGKAEQRGALPVLRVLEKLENFASVQAELNYLTIQTQQALLGSAEYIALKTAQARLISKSGDFKKALQLITSDLEHPAEKKFSQSEKLLFDSLVSTACQAQALADCQSEILSSCATLPSWKDWARGCKLKKRPETFASYSEALGYWYGAASRIDENINFAQWEETKKEFQTGNSDFENDVTAALDLALTVKSEEALNLVPYANALSTQNPLWGWAHKIAIASYGSQWAELMKKSDQAQIAFLELKPEISERVVASVKKKKKPKTAKKTPSHHQKKNHHR